jgi:hypothetical protein
LPEICAAIALTSNGGESANAGAPDTMALAARPTDPIATDRTIPRRETSVIAYSNYLFDFRASTLTA